MSYLILDSNSVWGRLKRIENDNGRSVKEYTGLVLQDIAREIVYYSIAAKASQTKDTDRSMVPSVKTVSDSTAPFLLRRTPRFRSVPVPARIRSDLPFRSFQIRFPCHFFLSR